MRHRSWSLSSGLTADNLPPLRLLHGVGLRRTPHFALVSAPNPLPPPLQAAPLRMRCSQPRGGLAQSSWGSLKQYARLRSWTYRVPQGRVVGRTLGSEFPPGDSCWLGTLVKGKITAYGDRPGCELSLLLMLGVLQQILDFSEPSVFNCTQNGDICLVGWWASLGDNDVKPLPPPPAPMARQRALGL